MTAPTRMALALFALVVFAASQKALAQQTQGAGANRQESAVSERKTTCTPALKEKFKTLEEELVGGCFSPGGVDAVCTPSFLGGVVDFLEEVDCAQYNAVVTECADSVDVVKVDSYVNCETGLEIISEANCKSFWVLRKFCG